VRSDGVLCRRGQPYDALRAGVKAAIVKVTEFAGGYCVRMDSTGR